MRFECSLAWIGRTSCAGQRALQIPNDVPKAGESGLSYQVQLIWTMSPEGLMLHCGRMAG